MDHFYQNIVPDYFSYPNLYRSFVNEAKDGDLIVEVGAFLGRSISYLGVEVVNSGKNILIDCIDSWDPSNCDVFYTDYDGSNYREYRGTGVYKLFLDNIKPLGRIIRSVRMPSIDASGIYEDESISFLFIDGDHSYNSVSNDLHAWYNKVKPGGIIAGHDWDGMEEVRMAVENFPLIVNEDISISENCWIYRKPKNQV